MVRDKKNLNIQKIFNVHKVCPQIPLIFVKIFPYFEDYRSSPDKFYKDSRLDKYWYILPLKPPLMK